MKNIFYIFAIVMLIVFVFANPAFCMQLVMPVNFTASAQLEENHSCITAEYRDLLLKSIAGHLPEAEQDCSLSLVSDTIAPIQIEPIQFDKNQILIDRKLRSEI